MAALRASEAMEIVEELCGGLDGFQRVWEFAREPWERNLEDLCDQRITPDEYVRQARVMIQQFKENEFNQAFEEKLVNARKKE